MLRTWLRHGRRFHCLVPRLGVWNVAVGLTVLGFCTASLVMLADMRRDTMSRSVATERNLLNVLSLDIARNVELYDLSLRAVVEGLAEPGFDALTPRVQDLLLYDRSATATNFEPILVLDRTGHVVRASAPGYTGADLSGREDFQNLRADPRSGLFISKPFRQPTGTGDVIALAHALQAPAGSFNGVVAGTLRPAYFKDLFATATLGLHGMAGLMLRDGTMIVRVPDVSAPVGRTMATAPNYRHLLSAPSGTFDGRSALDGVARTYSFTQIADLPFIVMVGVSESDVLSSWRAKAGVIGAALLSLCVVAVALIRLNARSQVEHRLLADNAIDLIVRLDNALRRTYVSPSCASVLGYQPAELLGGTPREIVHPEDWDAVALWVAEANHGSAIGKTTFRMRRKDGVYVWMEARCRAVPERRGFLVVLQDISERRAAEGRAAALTAELAELANSDGLTGLANRRRFDEVLSDTWSRAVVDDLQVSLLLLDVDRFKDFNDRYGHQEGDVCLRRIADAVSRAMTGPNALVARYGGEELAVVLPATDARAAHGEAERVRDAVERLAIPHAGSREGRVTLSIGLATMTPVAGSTEELRLLVNTADTHLYEAKRIGRNAVVSALEPDPHAGSRAGRHRGPESRPSPQAMPDDLDAICRLAAQVFCTAAAFVALGSREQATVAGRHGAAMLIPDGLDGFCGHVFELDEPLVVLDAAAENEGRALWTDLRGRFMAGVPIVGLTAGERLGVLCLVDERPRASFDRVQREVLVGLARLAAGGLFHPSTHPLDGVRLRRDVA